jgi:trehalose utilization protein
MRVTVWAEPIELSSHPRLRALQAAYHADTLTHYPDGIHAVIRHGLEDQLGDAATVSVASLDDLDEGLGEELLANTDVLVWWSHTRNDEVSTPAAERVVRRVREHGMGLVVLHSALESKPFLALMGTSCRMERWRQGDDAEAVWTVKPSHAIAQGVPPVFVIPREEMYAEFVDIPEPDELVFISSFSGGEICRSGCCFHRGKGRIFYFRPGHEAHPTFHQPEVRRVVANATQWAYSPVLSPAIFDETWEVKQGEVGWFASA